MGIGPNLINAIALALAASLAMTAPAASQATMSTRADHAILVDHGSGSVLFEKEADTPMVPASMVKVMTAEIVFKEIRAGRLSLDTTFRISNNAWKTGGAGSGGSTMFARVGSDVRVEDLLRGIIVQSGNDAAIALAEGVAGTEEAFANLMTQRGREVGMRNTTFRNAWGGHHPEQITTARDLAILARHVIDTYPEFYKMYAETEFTWNKIRQTNRNPLLSMNIGADGIKTGMVTQSGFGLMGSAVEGDRRLILVVNGLKSARERAEESRKLLAWGMRAFESRKVFDEGEVVGTATVYGGSVRSLPVAPTAPVVALVPRGSSERLSGRIAHEAPLRPPIKAGEEVATLRVFSGDRLLLEAPLAAAEDVSEGSLPQRARDAGLEMIRSLFNEYVLGRGGSDSATMRESGARDNI
jgi:D-alanyl-D-alanine carboxypeptidase (penicillin-binding protein 5/6)